MDRSETYIKMSDCEEIQKLRSGEGLFHEGDIIGVVDSKKDWHTRLVTPKYHGKGRSVCLKRETGVWLPRQDDLQKMVGGFQAFPKFWQEFNGYDNGFDLDEAEWSFCKDFTSMEQLWLAFVMFERYQKIWSGTKWNTVS